MSKLLKKITTWLAIIGLAIPLNAIPQKAFAATNIASGGGSLTIVGKTNFQLVDPIVLNTSANDDISASSPTPADIAISDSGLLVGSTLEFDTDATITIITTGTVTATSPVVIASSSSITIDVTNNSMLGDTVTITGIKVRASSSSTVSGIDKLKIVTQGAPDGVLGGDITIDAQNPTLSTVAISSNNSTPSVAKTGDTVSLAITASETISTPTVTVSGQPTIVTGSGSNYPATRILDGSESEGVLTFLISNITDSNGNSGTNVSSTTNSSSVTFDKTSPTISQTTPVTTPTNDTTPDYTFNSTEAGAITYTGNCSSATSSAISGANTVTFNTLAKGVHSNCTIIVTDIAGNISNTLSVTSFYVASNTQLPANTSNAVIDDTINSGVVLDGVNTTGDVTISIGEYTDKPDTSKLSGVSAFGKHFEIIASDTSKVTFPLTIKIYYTQTDLNNAGITEDKLDGIYFYNSVTGKYERYSDSGVNTTDVTVNGIPFAGYVWVNADHLTPITIAYDITSPDKPANLTATAGDSKVILTWDKVSDASGYKVRYRKSTSADTISYTEINVDSSTSSKEITGLENGIEYEFGIVAKDRVGNLSQYAVVVATPKASITTSTTPIVKLAATSTSQIITPQPFEDKSEIKKEEEKATQESTIDEGEIKGEETQTAGSRAAVTLAILLLALAAGVGGYYGYEWWVEKKLSGGPRYIPKGEKTVQTAQKKKIVKKNNRRNGRW